MMPTIDNRGTMESLEPVDNGLWKHPAEPVVLEFTPPAPLTSAHNRASRRKAERDRRRGVRRAQ